MTSGPLLLALLASFWLPAAWANSPDCGAVADRAAEIQSMRDRDAAAGVAAGRELLAELAESRPECPGAAMLVHTAVAANLHIQGRLDEALEQVTQALALIDASEDPSNLASVHRTAGVVFWEADAHDQALGHYQQALEYSRAVGDEEGAARTAGNIGNLHNTLGNWEEAERYHREALAGFEALEFRQGVAGTLVNLGALALRQASALEDEEAFSQARERYRANLDYNERALAIFEALDNPRGIAYAADNIARALVSLDQADEALSYHERSLELRREVGDRAGIVQSLLTGADIHRSLGRPDAALALVDDARTQVAEENTSLHRQVIERQSKLLAELDEWERAFALRGELMRMNQAAATQEITARAEAMEIRHRANELQRELDLERARAELSEQRVRRQRAISAASIITAALLLVIVVLIYSRYRLGQRVSRALDRVARTDALTGLPNRRDMSEQIDRAIARCRSEGEPACLIMADIDSFKRINDTLGHQEGDRILVHVSDLLRRQLRGQDCAARWGGEEFLILLPDTALAGAVSVSENLRQALAAERPQIGGRELQLTMTYGVAEITPEMAFNDALKAVDDAMYGGKARGKDRVVTFDEIAS